MRKINGQNTKILKSLEIRKLSQPKATTPGKKVTLNNPKIINRSASQNLSDGSLVYYKRDPRKFARKVGENRPVFD